jgi:hypothetical protein
MVMTKKIFGCIFILLACILSIGVIGRLPTLFKDIFNFYAIFFAKLEAYEIGTAIGRCLGWLIHLGLIFLFGTYGLRWIKSKPATSSSRRPSA